MKNFLMISLLIFGSIAHAETCKISFIDDKGTPFLSRVDLDVQYGVLNELTPKFGYKIDVVQVKRKRELLVIELYKTSGNESVKVFCEPAPIVNNQNSVVGVSAYCLPNPEIISVTCNTKDQQAAFEELLKIKRN